MNTTNYLKAGALHSLAFGCVLLNNKHDIAPASIKEMSDAELVAFSVMIRCEAAKRNLPFEDMQAATVGYMRQTDKVDLKEIQRIVSDLSE